MSVETEISMVEIEETGELGMSGGEISNDIVCDSEEKSEGEEGEDVGEDCTNQKKTESVEEGVVSELNEDGVLESDDSTKVERDSSVVQDVIVVGSDEDVVGKQDAVVVGSDEIVIEDTDSSSVKIAEFDDYSEVESDSLEKQDANVVGLDEDVIAKTESVAMEFAVGDFCEDESDSLAKHEAVVVCSDEDAVRNTESTTLIFAVGGSCEVKGDTSAKHDAIVVGLDEDAVRHTESTTATTTAISESEGERAVGDNIVSLDEEVFEHIESTTRMTVFEHKEKPDDDDEKNLDTTLGVTVEIKSVQLELGQLDNLNQAQKDDNDKQVMLDSELEIGDNQDSQSTCMESVENNELELAGEKLNSQESEVIVAETVESTTPEDDVSVEHLSRHFTEEEGLELEVVACPVNNTKLDIEATDCIYGSVDCIGSSKGSSEGTDEDARSYVFVKRSYTVSDAPANRESVMENTTNLGSVAQKEESQVYPFFMVGKIACGPYQTLCSSTGNRFCSADTVKPEICMRNYSFDKVEYLPTSPTNEALAEAEVTNNTSKTKSNESVGSVSDGFVESEVGSGFTLSTRESTPSSSVETLDEKKTDEKMEKRPIFRYMIKVPRLFDDQVEEEIRLAQLQVDEMTQKRDAIGVAIETKKANCNEYLDKLEAAKSERKAGYDTQNVIRQEMDSVQSMLNKIKHVTLVEETANRIASMQRRIEHETIPLNEEKRLIRDMNQLKLHHQQLCSILDRQVETQLAFDEKEKLEERLKLLKKDLDRARNENRGPEGIMEAARKTLFNQNEELRDMQAQYRSANVLRQDAYACVQRLRKQLYDKNKYFRMYKDDAQKAHDYGFSGDREALQCHCVNQVERVMELWNNNDDFRNEYVRCNTWSTLRRLGTLDGRSLGPDEKRSTPWKNGDNKIAVTPTPSEAIDPVSPVPTLEQGKPVLLLGSQKTDKKAAVKPNQKHQETQYKEPIPSVSEDSSDTLSCKVKVEDKIEEKNRQIQEEELARKERELRKEAAAAKIREQHLLEERVKAKEAEERKRRNAEKAQAKAELVAQKEAELKEKARAKRQRRKERKAATKSINANESSVPSSENILPEPANQEPETEEKPTVIQTKALKPEVEQKQNKTVSKKPRLAKQAKKKVIPLPPSLRNKSKRKMQSWMWILLTVLIAMTVLIFLPRLRHILLSKSL